MRKLMHGAVVTVISLLTGCDPNALDRVCDPGATQCISLSKFQGNIDAAVTASNVVGYISVVGGLPQVKAVGYARTGADTPKLSWDQDVPINVMSLAKVFTTVAVMKVMTKNNINLTDKITTYLPPDWTPGSNIGKISFQDLLTHRSGFSQNTGANSTYADLKNQIETGVTNANYGQPRYDNNNFAIFRLMLPYMDKWTDPGAGTRAVATQTWYSNYMQEHVFKPAGVNDATTKPAGTPHGFWYPTNPTANTAGDDGGDWTDKAGGGGWSMSMGSLYRFLLALSGGDVLLTDAQKMSMDTNCLGWDCSVQTQMDFIGKNGIWNNQVWTFFGLFHQKKVLGLLIVNSPLSSNITTLMSNAFNSAWVAKGAP